MNRILNQRKTWLSLALFSGAFLSLYGLISGYEEGCGFFSCTISVNNIPITFIQEVLTYVGAAIFISCIGLMSVGEAGSGGHYPSKHAILDFAFILGAFIFAVGLGAFNALCSGVCWEYNFEFGFPLTLIGIDTMGFSLYFLRKKHRVNGEHTLGWELLAIGGLALLLVSTFLAMPSLQPVVPVVNYGSLSFQQYVFIFASLVGVVAGLGGIMNEKSKRGALMIPERNETALVKV
jgi:hypothetical protein